MLAFCWKTEQIQTMGLLLKQSHYQTSQTILDNKTTTTTLFGTSTPASSETEPTTGMHYFI